MSTQAIGMRSMQMFIKIKKECMLPFHLWPFIFGSELMDMVHHSMDIIDITVQYLNQRVSSHHFL